MALKRTTQELERNLSMGTKTPLTLDEDPVNALVQKKKTPLTLSQVVVLFD